MSTRVPSPSARKRLLVAVTSLLGAAVLSGCGSTDHRSATEQLVASGAVDSAIAQIDFRPLEGQRVFFDSDYIKDYKGIGFVNSNYIVSGLRQQMTGAGLLLQEKPEDADYVVEARVGALGTDGHGIVYGLPQNNALSAAASAASAVGGAPGIPVIPEISFARKESLSGAAKVAAFAYHRESRQRVWQSGLATAKSTAKDTWVLGAGPFQQGSIYDRVNFAGSELKLAGEQEGDGQAEQYANEILFAGPAERAIAEESETVDDIRQAAGEASEENVQQASAESERAADDEPAKAEAAPAETPGRVQIAEPLPLPPRRSKN